MDDQNELLRNINKKWTNIQTKIFNPCLLNSDRNNETKVMIAVELDKR